MNWYNAMAYARNLKLGGYDDWRVPTLEEYIKSSIYLSIIFKYDCRENKQMKKHQLATTKSTELILGKSKSLMGLTKKILESKTTALTKHKESQELEIHEDITIIGNLMWEKESKEMTWHEAMEYAKNLRLGGYDDWRLPTLDEMIEVVRDCGGKPVRYGDDDGGTNIHINNENEAYQICLGAKGFAVACYWSSTKSLEWSNTAWSSCFFFGELAGNDMDNDTISMRCIGEKSLDIK